MGGGATTVEHARGPEDERGAADREHPGAPGDRIAGVDLDLSAASELTPTLFALAAFADAPSTLHGIGHIRGHETDRIAALVSNLRALGGDDLPVGVRLVVEGSEEQGTGGLDRWVEANPGALAADAMLVQDTGNAELGLPTLTVTLRGAANVVVHVEALEGEIHSGMFGGAAPDALAALVAILASLRDEHGDTTIDGVPAAVAHGTWDGVAYDEDQFRRDAGVLDGVGLVGTGSVADRLWARPVVTILGIDAPSVVGSAAAIQPRAAARLNLRVPPGADAQDLQDKLVAHLEAHAPWGVRVRVERDAVGQPFAARTSGHVFDTLTGALADAYGRETVTAGQGGSIPLCNVLAGQYPDAEIVLLGVEEPACLIHAPNESVAPSEIENLAVGEALFLARLGEG